MITITHITYDKTWLLKVHHHRIRLVFAAVAAALDERMAYAAYQAGHWVMRAYETYL